MMRDTSLLFTPLQDEVGFGGTPFSTDSNEYLELQCRLQTIQRFVDSTEAALRMIVRQAASKSKPRDALENILHLALDQVNLAALATVMLDDINSCLNFIERKNLDSLDEELDALLGDLTRPDSTNIIQQQ